MAGDVSITESNRDAITALMVIQLNHFLFNRTWQFVSTVPDATEPYPSGTDVPQLPYNIAQTVITAYCQNGENVAATFSGALSAAAYGEISAAGLFGNENAIFEISFHPDHIDAVESSTEYEMVAFQVSTDRAVGIGTSSRVQLNYQCAQGITRYVQTDPNDGDRPLKLVANSVCIPPSQCVDEDYWVVTGYNSDNQPSVAQRQEDRPLSGVFFLSCDLS